MVTSKKQNILTILIRYSSLLLAIMALVASTQEDTLLEEMRRAKFRTGNWGHHSDYSETMTSSSRGRSRSKHREAKTGPSRDVLQAEITNVLPLFIRPPAPNYAKSSTIDVESMMPFAEPRVMASRLMMFTWQCPLMLMSYSWVSFFFALLLYLVEPFITHKAWGDDSKVLSATSYSNFFKANDVQIAIMYLVVAGFCVVAFFGSATWPRIQSKNFQHAMDKVKKGVEVSRNDPLTP